MTARARIAEPVAAATRRRPRIGFLGVGWIGLDRMRGIVDAGQADVVALCDPSREMRERAGALAPDAVCADGLDAVLDQAPDGIVVATPSALHAEQAIAALERGVAVFCQKPLGRTAAEAGRVVAAARRADRLLGVDLSYRRTEGLARLREAVLGGALGEVFAADLVFHNAYGPDKPWYFDKALSGGGCVIDLGVHLADLALWLFPGRRVEAVESRLYRAGRLLAPATDTVEDAAFATLTLEGGATVRLACSWHLHAGRGAVIGAELYGTEGGAAFRNVDGSFYDFTAALHRGTETEVLCAPPDAWGPRAACDWAARLAAGERFDPAAEDFVAGARLVDRIYGR